ncbi:TetR/AcrR family transcriptional regulator [Rhodococcus sp. IEGM 1401]|uniref:TetR/AcrR family transcriptional regulator n=1 Tax=unclassified Rhodococcus (in: high G+C Gram-positive bacteria) TaxID=192944 RepID=UPI0022B5DEFD|nr:MULTISPECIES: TetR/AcrR family transcriptional regulator [unclassified Rhodococcus (in: high G+C Gram-positive bacteria)]MCZ4561709.1 TetR/AcrR family transcriptional regulator [Rhodococcus sp. IEGM 1401]MDI9921908.1 TetR/AcrR family transcriptional regulator [Rhodococcus sp. IEGM 1372]MDV8034304.1 TetR/AcrR family transcriptional regulator [Rhodococcus sp. IEGM 1414]MDV8078805.1 TetR/AcrR family transcriptional regulator [Rhodococcus sp. IEGM 1370]
MSTVSEAAGRAYGGESAADRDDRRRRQLLDAGLRVFGSVGYRAATVRGLCREAKIADRDFYRHFDKTEDLLLAVYSECIARLTDSVSDAIVQVDRDGDLRDVAKQLLDPFFQVIEDPHLARVVWMEVLGVSPRVEQTYLTVMQQFGTLLLGYLRTFAGDVPSGPDLDVDLLATAAIGGISHTAMTWYQSGYAADRRIVVATIATMLANIVSPLAAESARH